MMSEDFYYCPTCQNEIYYKKCKVNFTTKINEVCTNPLTGGYLDRYNYEKRKERYIEFLCPNDETILKSNFIDYEII